MRRYIPNRPSRREVRAALDFYKPHDWDGGIMPEDFSNEEVYRPGRCWWTFKGRKFDTPQHTCAVPATLYEMRKNQSNLASTPGVTAVRLYVCDKHATKLRANGYTLTKVCAPPSQPQGIIKP